MGGSSGKEREDVAMVVGLVFWSVANKLTFSCACNKIKYTQRRLAGEDVVTLIWQQSENMLLINVACPHRIGTQSCQRFPRWKEYNLNFYLKIPPV